MALDEDELAELYDWVHRGNPGDLHFYRRHCCGAQSVLELGCGSGRVLLALPEPGLRRVGLDLQRGMLRRARASSSSLWLLCGDMARFSLRCRFDRILIPYNGLYCLVERERMLACLRLAAAHLAEEGRLIFDLYAVDPEEHGGDSTAAEADEEPSHVVSIEHRGQLVEVYERSRWDPAQQRIDAVYEYRWANGELLTEIAIPQRYLFVQQLASLLAEAGLKLGALYDDPKDDGAGTSPADWDEAADWMGVVASVAPLTGASTHL